VGGLPRCDRESCSRNTELHAVAVRPIELVERIGVEGEIEESFWIITGLDAMVNELMEERGFPDAPPSNEAEKRLVLELAVGLVGTGEMIEVALLSCRE